jgi:hypothetical protein
MATGIFAIYLWHVECKVEIFTSGNITAKHQDLRKIRED